MPKERKEERRRLGWENNSRDHFAPGEAGERFHPLFEISDEESQKKSEKGKNEGSLKERLKKGMKEFLV